MHEWTVEEIKALRQRLKLSRGKLGTLVGVTETYVYMLETGRKTPSKTLCIVFDCLEKQYHENGERR
jgi:DNA-binding XRE family transcriptional regulator